MQAGELMLTAGEVGGLNELAIVLLMLTHWEASLMLFVLEVAIKLCAAVTFEFESV